MPRVNDQRVPLVLICGPAKIDDPNFGTDGSLPVLLFFLSDSGSSSIREVRAPSITVALVTAINLAFHLNLLQSMSVKMNQTYNWGLFRVSDNGRLIMLQQNVLWLQVRMCESHRVKELNRFQRLKGDVLHMAYLEPLITIRFYEVVETLPKGFKYQTCVFPLMCKEILQIYNVLVNASLLFDVKENVGLYLGALSVPVHCSDHFNGDLLLTTQVFTLQSSAESSIP